MTTTPLTDQQLDAIEQRTKAATDGPWTLHEDDGDTFRAPAWEVQAATGEMVARVRDWASADAEFIAHAPEDVHALLAEVRRLRAAMGEIQHLHCDSPMGPCPVCFDADAAAAGGDGLVPYPCPTGRLAGNQDCDPPHVRAAHAAAAAVAGGSR